MSSSRAKGFMLRLCYSERRRTEHRVAGALNVTGCGRFIVYLTTVISPNYIHPVILRWRKWSWPSLRYCPYRRWRKKNACFLIFLRFLSLGLPQIKSLRSKTSYSRRSESFHSRRNCNCATRNVSKCDTELWEEAPDAIFPIYFCVIE